MAILIVSVFLYIMNHNTYDTKITNADEFIEDSIDRIILVQLFDAFVEQLDLLKLDLK
ncbi:MAG: hypothetical protein IPM86_12900 [Saprospiraceae bacterium]|nr:hypothetical protein [Saprospiraceae bacterium]